MLVTFYYTNPAGNPAPIRTNQAIAPAPRRFPPASSHEPGRSDHQPPNIRAASGLTTSSVTPSESRSCCLRADANDFAVGAGDDGSNMIRPHRQRVPHRHLVFGVIVSTRNACLVTRCVIQYCFD